MRTNIKLVILCIAILFLLTGCKSTLVVRNANIEQIILIFKDYVGTHGYKITYENPQTGSYRLDLGSMYVPEVSETTKSQTTTHRLPPRDSGLPLTAYEETTWRTISTPGHYVQATARVNINQQGQNVVIDIETSEFIGTSLNDMRDYIRGFGFIVD